MRPARVSSALIVAKSKTPTSINFVGSSLYQDAEMDSSLDESLRGAFEKGVDAPVVVEYMKEEDDEEEEEEEKKKPFEPVGNNGDRTQARRRRAEMNTSKRGSRETSRAQLSVCATTTFTQRVQYGRETAPNSKKFDKYSTFQLQDQQ